MLKATHSGVLNIADIDLPCFVLEDGRRVLSERGLVKALGGKKRGEREIIDGTKLPSFMASETLKPFIGNKNLTATKIDFITPNNKMAHGYGSELLTDVCICYSEAQEAGVIRENQQHIATRANQLLRAFAKVGLTALIDEATGYQSVRGANDLQNLFCRYLSDEKGPYKVLFKAFHKEMCRLHHWVHDPVSNEFPSYMGSLTIKYVYEPLMPGIHDVLRERSKKDGGKFSQHLNEDLGLPALKQTLNDVVTLATISPNLQQFTQHHNVRFYNSAPQLMLGMTS